MILLERGLPDCDLSQRCKIVALRLQQAAMESRIILDVLKTRVSAMGAMHRSHLDSQAIVGYNKSVIELFSRIVRNGYPPMGGESDPDSTKNLIQKAEEIRRTMAARSSGAPQEGLPNS